MQFVLNIPKNLSLKLIRFYQKFLSPDQSFWGRGSGQKVCIHTPTCSQYTYEAIEKHGAVKGIIMGSFRILRCNPFVKGGHDPVPDKFSIKRNSQVQR